MDRPIQDDRPGRWLYRVLLPVVGTLLLVTLAVKTFSSSMPLVDHASIVIDTARIGPLDKVIAGPGRLVPAEERVIAANARALIVLIDHEPGDVLAAGDIVMRLENRDTDLSFLEAKRQLTTAEAELVSLEADLDQQLLDQEVLMQKLTFEQRDAQRVVDAYDDLATTGGIADLDVRRAHDGVVEVGERIAIEERKTAFLHKSRIAKLDAQRAKTEQMRNLVAFQEQLVADLVVTAPTSGVLQDLLVEEGQWVEPGQMLARVTSPDDLKVELRLPQTDADEIAVGQIATIDTRIGVVAGHVFRVDPAVKDGAVIVEVVLDEELPTGARAQLTVYGTITSKQLGSVLSILRPSGTIPYATKELFRVQPDSRVAHREEIVFGDRAGDRIEIIAGATEGDQFIVSDVSTWSDYSKVELTQ